MRILDNNIINALSEGKNFVYLYELYKGDDIKFLTSHYDVIKFDDKTYLPYSGLSISNMIFNDSAKDQIEIDGIFEPYGIDRSDDITGYSFKIFLYFVDIDHSYYLLEYFCSKMIIMNLRFKILLEPFSAKLQKSVLESYSVNCRAELGDRACGINKNLYANDISCDKKIITCCNKFNNAVNFRGEPFIPELKQ